MLERAPSAGVAQFTPALLLSLATVAVNVTESCPSTVDDDVVTETLMGLEPPPPPPLLLEPPPPQPERQSRARIVITNSVAGALVHKPVETNLDLDIWRPFDGVSESCEELYSSIAQPGAVCKSVRDGILTAIASAEICMLIAVAGGFFVELLVVPPNPALVSTWAEFKRSGWTDPYAFGLANALDSGFTHLLIAPVVALIFGSVSSLLTRFLSAKAVPARA